VGLVLLYLYIQGYATGFHPEPLLNHSRAVSFHRWFIGLLCLPAMLFSQMIDWAWAKSLFVLHPYANVSFVIMFNPDSRL
jgi:hypothetical protein